MVLFPLCLALTLAGAAPFPPDEGSIGGLVRNGSRAEAPAGSVDVLLRARRLGGDFEVVARTISDPQGHFLFEGLPIDQEVQYLPGAARGHLLPRPADPARSGPASCPDPAGSPRRDRRAQSPGDPPIRPRPPAGARGAARDRDDADRESRGGIVHRPAAATGRRPGDAPARHPRRVRAGDLPRGVLRTALRDDRRSTRDRHPLDAGEARVEVPLRGPQRRSEPPLGTSTRPALRTRPGHRPDRRAGRGILQPRTFTGPAGRCGDLRVERSGPAGRVSAPRGVRSLDDAVHGVCPVGGARGARRRGRRREPRPRTPPEAHGAGDVPVVASVSKAGNRWRLRAGRDVFPGVSDPREESPPTSPSARSSTSSNIRTTPDRCTRLDPLLTRDGPTGRGHPRYAARPNLHRRPATRTSAPGEAASCPASWETDRFGWGSRCRHFSPAWRGGIPDVPAGPGRSDHVRSAHCSKDSVKKIAGTAKKKRLARVNCLRGLRPPA